MLLKLSLLRKPTIAARAYDSLTTEVQATNSTLTHNGIPAKQMDKNVWRVEDTDAN